MTYTVEHSPRVSIGLPVFNGENYLSEAIQSILAQTYKDFELIISDNASTDNTYDICQNFMKVDKRIKYFRNEINLGGAYNDNHVFLLSSGLYFKWAAHDDICAPTLIERCVHLLEQDLSIVLCYPRTMIIDDVGQVVEKYHDTFNLLSSKPNERYRQVLGQNYLLNPIYGVIRSDALRKTQLIKKYIASDRVLLGELALQGKFFEVPEYLFFRRIHPKKSTVINKTTEQLTNWYDPDAIWKIQIPKTRRFLDFFISIQKSQLRSKDKLSCYYEFFKYYLSPDLLVRRLSGFIKESQKAFPVILNNIFFHNKTKRE